MFEFINFLRAFATILITNSHYEVVYPIQALGTGGLLGNSIFFIVSGFCLANGVKRGFVSWFSKRITRIYPACFIATIFGIVIGRFEIGGIYDFVASFIYPTKFGFIGTIILLYIPYYFVVNYFFTNNRSVKLYMCLLVFFNLAVFLTSLYTKQDYFIKVYYFDLMLSGVFLKKYKIDADKHFGIYSVALVGLYYVIEILKKKVLLPYFVILLNYGVLLLATVCIFQWAKSKEAFFKNIDSSVVRKIIGFLSTHTLEIYIIQVVILRYTPNVAFPINAIVLTGEILIGAMVLHICCDKMIKMVVRRND